jgi:hypothetical protein
VTDNVTRPQFNAADALTRDFLVWLEDAPRTYAEALDVWRTSCPRLSIWEDALADELIQIESAPGRTSNQDRVTLTFRGRAVLEALPPVAKSPPLSSSPERG